ncbi:NAD(P)/FAD-dependent oxidoreductase [Roseateles paludis]|jgi:thioredoxin reductase (NADPH)|uniref:Ferredoxin--NADP reductase n=1 Tax=Roseateles paludis TaxID=3145238 RepID=A0ABV0G2W5_9BURK
MNGQPLIETDAVVIGAGPVGLFQVFQLGLQEIRAHVIDSLPHAGGQCVELYPDKPIYDVPGLPVCTGQELADRLLQQARPFAPEFHLGQEVSQLSREADGRWRVETASGTRLLSKTVFIAGGVGSFQPRRLRLEGIEPFEGRSLHYRPTEAARFVGRQMIVLGGDAPAVRWALTLATGPAPAASVTLVHRRDALRAEPADLAALQTLREAGTLRFVAGQPIGFQGLDGQLSHLRLATPEGAEVDLPCTDVIACLGLSPKLGPIANWGLAMEHKLLSVDPARFETSEPGIFAVGDVNTYPGKRKLLVCGFHEATLAAFAAVETVFPGKRVLLQYTTTSPRLHQLLGVAPAPTGD